MSSRVTSTVPPHDGQHDAVVQPEACVRPRFIEQVGTHDLDDGMLSLDGVGRQAATVQPARALLRRLAAAASKHNWIHINSTPAFRAFTGATLHATPPSSASTGISPLSAAVNTEHAVFSTLMHGRSTVPLDQDTGDSSPVDPSVPLPMAHFFFDPASRTLHSALYCQNAMSGNPGIIHGGCSSLLVDEMCGLLCVAAGLSPGFTANLSVDFRAPIVLPRALYGVARIKATDNRKITMTASLSSDEEAADERTTFVDATALYIRSKR